MPQKKHSRLKIIIDVVMSALMIAASLFLVLNRQYVLDQINVWSFKPSDSIIALENRSGMNSYGKFLFLASHPLIDGTQSFNNECEKAENTVSILGCYNGSRIYVYDVTSSDLDGIKEVTSAHEMLHAAYDRLSSNEKNQLQPLLEAEYEKLESNKDYADRMDFYSRTEPGEKYNELHSVIGTEVSDIDPKLETYYKRYFSNRSNCTTFYKKYSDVFRSLKDKANALLNELNSLNTSINADLSTYNSTLSQLNADISSFNRLASSGYFESQTEFNKAKSLLEARISKLESTRATINSSIEKYNSLLAEYNSNAAESNKLYDSIDSSLAPAPSL
ncbi:hypothetical protein HGB24_01390 [Candidatus Saccharibacteria bacterium]|nr:hypothetical protein [Candidatus Saccharibacteria bacterium]